MMLSNLGSRSPWSRLILAGVFALLGWSVAVSAQATTSTRAAARRSSPENAQSSSSYRFGRFLPGIDPYDPFDPRNNRELLDVIKPSASSASPSAPAPTATSISLQGYIQVRATSNGTNIGYVTNTLQGLNGVTTNETNKLSVALDVSRSSLVPVDITAQNPKFSGPNKVGGIAIARDASPNLAVDSSNAVLLSNVPQTPPGSRPVSTSQGTVESAIWTLNQVTMELTAHWINTNGQSPSTVIAYNQNNNTLYLTGQQPSGSADLITVTFFLDSDA